MLLPVGEEEMIVKNGEQEESLTPVIVNSFNELVGVASTEGLLLRLKA